MVNKDILKVVAIIAQKDFRDEELFDTKTALEENGVSVRVAARSFDQAIGKLGGKIMPDLRIADIRVQDFAGCVLIGGPGAYDLITDLELRDVVLKFAAEEKLLSAICIASAILAEAGVLRDKRATIHFSGADYLARAGAIYAENDLEIDGNIITGSGPAIAAKFGQEIANYLKNNIRN